MAKLYLALGSNIGARQANIMSALSFLNGALGRYEALSDIVSTEAFGFDGPEFLNCVARYSTRKRPETILSLCKEIPHSGHRHPDLRKSEYEHPRAYNPASPGGNASVHQTFA